MKNFISELTHPTSARSQKRSNILLAVMWMLVAVLAVANIAHAVTEKQGTEMWIICQPGDWINARENASKTSSVAGRLECGDRIWLDGKARSGFCHIINATFETNEAWVFAGYISDEEPKDMGGAVYEVDANGRVACRKYIEGPRRCWVVRGSEVAVYYMTSEWAVTNKGFIRSEYLREKYTQVE